MKRFARKNKRQKDPRIVLGAPEGRITPRAGLHLVAKLDRLLSIGRTISQTAPSVKLRRRGLSLGEVVVSLAEMMLSGGDFLVDLDHQRNDAAGLQLRAVPEVPASTTAIGIGKRFDAEVRRGVERANAALVARAFALLVDKRRAQLVATGPTIDLDPTTVEVYGHMKEGAAYNYKGENSYRPHPAIWAETGWALATDLGSGRSDPRPQAPSLIARAVAGLPEGLLPPIMRADSGSSTTTSRGRLFEAAATSRSRPSATRQPGERCARSKRPHGARPRTWTQRWPPPPTCQPAGPRGPGRS